LLIFSVYLEFMVKKIKALSLKKTKTLVPTWSIKKNQLYKKFIFSNFSDALGFIVQIGIESEKLDHHPTLSNTYNKVEVYLSTHSIGGLSDLDIQLANNIDNI
jgi:4a-hydroxytetrahydrobiopterin dehydratase